MALIGGHVIAVYSSPDRPIGRGRKLAPSPVKAHALERGIPVLTPTKLAGRDEQTVFEKLEVDLVIVAAYGLLLPKAFLVTPSYGAINVHPSLLPRHRGAAPVPAAILAGDRVSGTTLIKMDEGLDTGPVLAMREVLLMGDERASSLTAALFELGGEMLEENLPLYIVGGLLPIEQSADGASITKKFTKEDGLLDWTCSAVDLERRIRALEPWPGSATIWQGQRIDVLEASVNAWPRTPAGQVFRLGDAIAVGTGEGALILERVRLAGRKAMTAHEFVHGRAAFMGTVLPS